MEPADPSRTVQSAQCVHPANKAGQCRSCGRTVGSFHHTGCPLLERVSAQVDERVRDRSVVMVAPRYAMSEPLYNPLAEDQHEIARLAEEAAIEFGDAQDEDWLVRGSLADEMYGVREGYPAADEDPSDEDLDAIPGPDEDPEPEGNSPVDLRDPHDRFLDGLNANLASLLGPRSTPDPEEGPGQ